MKELIDYHKKAILILREIEFNQTNIEQIISSMKKCLPVYPQFFTEYLQDIEIAKDQIKELKLTYEKHMTHDNS